MSYNKEGQAWWQTPVIPSYLGGEESRITQPKQKQENLSVK
jgi:hypothetical protein